MTAGEHLVPRRFGYGPDPSHHADLYAPDGSRRPGTVVLIHGGFWRARFGLEIIQDVAWDLCSRGWVVWNIEYRRVGGGGGWPDTLLDVAAAIDHLAVMNVDRSRVVAIGHSAGGHLAAWAAGRHTEGRDPSGEQGWGEDLDEAVPGRNPAVEVTGVISLAGVLDLATAAAEGIGNDAVRSFMGGDQTRRPARYAATDPLAQVPIKAAVYAVHGRGDFNVPFEQSLAYVEKARAAGQEATLVDTEGDHFTVIDTASVVWPQVVEALVDLTG
ncbi:MAG: alpha/beta hydrolase [Acidimicrobiaceae bacterium]|nr:alpha/beta hydrolase [Acidimicrobiaceae bacterium]